LPRSLKDATCGLLFVIQRARERLGHDKLVRRAVWRLKWIADERTLCYVGFVDLNAQLRQSEGVGLDLMADLVMTELAVDSTLCDVAKNYE
jgi:hypothetical protein